jgi:hypothetical protein
MATSRQTIIEIKVPPKAVGTVIGRRGGVRRNFNFCDGLTGRCHLFCNSSVVHHGFQHLSGKTKDYEIGIV